MSQQPLMRKPKKLIICCDGTWMNSDSGKKQTPSNVTRIGQAIVSENNEGHPQIVYYQAGVGTGLGLAAQVYGGGTGDGLSENIREAYSFLTHNYTDGDEIYLVGFSRGAFTARSIAGLIGGFGLLEKQALPYFYDIFQDWENTGVKEYKPNAPTNIPGFKCSVQPANSRAYLDAYKQALIDLRLSQEVCITAIGCWDTVGALGIPTTPLLQKLGFPDFLKEWKWYDTQIDEHVKNAFHALALDETRASYAPTLWDKGASSTTNLKQVWFPGVHSNVGGSYADTSIADITLAWMMDQLSPWIEFEPGYITRQFTLNQAFNATDVSRPVEAKKGWSLGYIKQSNRFPTSLGGKENRCPMTYHARDPGTGEFTKESLTDTAEFVHASVRARIDLKGLAWEDKGTYKPAGLNDWRLHDEHGYHDEIDTGTPIVPSASNGITTNGVARAGTLKRHIRWEYAGPNPALKGRFLLEDNMGPIELELLAADAAAYKAVFEN